MGFVKSYMKDGTTNSSTLGVKKRLFHDCCMANPVIAQAVDFSVRVEAAQNWLRTLEMMVIACLSSADMMTFPGVNSTSQMRQHVRFVRNFIMPKSDCKRGIKIHLFHKYCLGREQQRPSSQPVCVARSSAAMQEYSGQ